MVKPVKHGIDKLEAEMLKLIFLTLLNFEALVVYLYFI